MVIICRLRRFFNKYIWFWLVFGSRGDRAAQIFLPVWWARRDSNPQGLFIQRILSPPRIPIPPLARVFGGTYRNWTGVKGFADLCVTTPPRCHNLRTKRCNNILCRSAKQVLRLVLLTRQNFCKQVTKIARSAKHGFHERSQNIHASA